jgi:hypothetical protein
VSVRDRHSRPVFGFDSDAPRSTPHNLDSSSLILACNEESLRNARVWLRAAYAPQVLRAQNCGKELSSAAVVLLSVRELLCVTYLECVQLCLLIVYGLTGCCSTRSIGCCSIRC